ncbi:hypothetical protein JHK85_002448 [Glycine max]|nr:hypothetical protein JHK85_002448 [Glycine max]KAG5089771.1 hypothetical protein JHK86_002383 [Glycine max]
MERLITSFSLGTTENNVRAAKKRVIDFGDDFVRALNVFHPSAPVVQMINALLCEAEIKLSDEMIETITNKHGGKTGRRMFRNFKSNSSWKGIGPPGRDILDGLDQ